MTVIEEIEAERKRQIEEEGWTAEHDDSHDAGVLAMAASSYAFYTGYDDITREVLINTGNVPPTWPWDRKWWKPTTRRRDLVKAAALIVAEIERLDRLDGEN